MSETPASLTAKTEHVWVHAKISVPVAGWTKLKKAADTCVTETRKEEGAIKYGYHTPFPEGDTPAAADVVTIMFIECFKSMDALKAHFETDHLKAFGKAIEETGAKTEVTKWTDEIN